jgi:hypothetical protein
VQRLLLRKDCAAHRGLVPAGNGLVPDFRGRARTALQLDVRYVTKRPYLAAAKEFLGG